MEKQLKEFGLSQEEIDEMVIDSELFIKLFSLYEKMSKRGKQATIDTLIMFLIKEE